jgi:predicted secreted Zn-dependent protease
LTAAFARQRRPPDFRVDKAHAKLKSRQHERMTMKANTTIAGWALMLLAGLAHADVQEKLDFQDYAVSAQEGDNLGRVISDAFPIGTERRSHGYTHWNLRWDARWAPDNGGCRITSATVSLEMTVTLPRLDAGTAQQRRLFAGYLPRLREHEMGHVETNRASARAADAFLRALRVDGGCKDMQREAAAGVKEVIERNRALNVQYDDRTDHGRTQGARIASR